MPEEVKGRTKWRIALDEIDRVRQAGVRFGCVPGDADYGKVAAFRHALDERGLRWAMAIPPTHTLFPLDVTTALPERKKHGCPPTRPIPDEASVPAASLFADPPDAAFRTLSWRTGSKGPLTASFGARRLRVADGPLGADGRHLPGEEVWLVCEHRATGERKFYLANHPSEATLEELAAAIKARWACEQAHQQLKDELGLDHYEGRGWIGLHHHALLCLIALAFLQAMRLGGENRPRVDCGAGAGAARPTRIGRDAPPRPAAQTDAARGATPRRGRAPQPPRPMSELRTWAALA